MRSDDTPSPIGQQTAEKLNVFDTESSASTISPRQNEPNEPQGTTRDYPPDEVRAALDRAVKGQRVSYHYLHKNGVLVFRSWEVIEDGAVMERLKKIIQAIRIAAPVSPPVHQALQKSSGVAIIASE